MATGPRLPIPSSFGLAQTNRETMIVASSSSSQVLAAATLFTLRAVAASGGNGSATLALCVHVDGVVEAASASDRLSSVTRYDQRRVTTTTGPDRADEYALAQCRPDVPADECLRCLNACLGTLDTHCDSAAVRYDSCLLRSSPHNFSSFDVDEYTVAVFDGNAPSLPKKVPTGLLGKVAANATANRSRTAAGIADYPDAAATGGRGRASVYGLAQCITQMTAHDCGSCLRGALSRLSDEFNSTAGMQVLRPSCMLRYAGSPFFNASLLPVAHVTVPEGDGAAAPEGSISLPQNKDRGKVIALSCSAGGAAILALILVALWCRRRGRKSKIATGGGKYSYQTLVNATANFSEENRLGSGGCGVVYKGILENKKEIAIKKLARKNLEELKREVSLVAELQHENLVKFLGHCFQDDKMFLVYEYLSNKSLSNYFKGSAEYQKLDWAKWLNIIKGVARGLTYLHLDSGKDIVHRDLKPSNVLLDSNFAAKIADFDLARGYNRERSHESTRNMAGTYGYIAPECYAEGKFSTKSDVYSFGVLVLEILVGQSINRFENDNCTGLVEHVWQHWSDLRVGDVLERDHLGLGNHEQMQQASRCVQVALLCVQNDRSRRPAMDEVTYFLSNEMLVPDPSAPGYITAPPGSGPPVCSVNDVTISMTEPRS
ncbi:cysteine-rich receptor-like protein kinase 25 [Triticum dicoccoides]|nr:cysteine-rich receptor-like protein kinase 25 [Triticum dicoccoides]